MRILHVVHQFLPYHRHGAEISTWELAARQQRLGHDVVVVAGEKGHMGQELVVERDEFKGLPVQRVFFNPRSPNGWLHHEGFARAGAEIIASFQPDVVHIQQLLNLSLSLVDECRKARVPTVFTLRDFAMICQRVNLVRGDGSLCRQSDLVHDCAACLKQDTVLRPEEKLSAALAMLGANMANPRSWRLLRDVARRKLSGQARVAPVKLIEPEDFQQRRDRVLEVLRQVDRITAISADTAARVEALAGESLDIQVLHQAPETERCRHRIRKRDAGNPLVIGYIGKMTYVKGVHVLLEAFRQLPAGQAELHLHGGPTITDLQQMAYWQRLQRTGQLPGVHFHPEGFAPDRIADVLDQFDVLVIPSIWFEAYGRVVVEALASGIPVICSDEGGPAELVHDGENGFHFRLGDAAALAERLRQLVEAPHLLEQLSRTAVKPKATYAYVDEVLSIYQDVLAGKASAANPENQVRNL